jgi:hypothetical protein
VLKGNTKRSDIQKRTSKRERQEEVTSHNKVLKWKGKEIIFMVEKVKRKRKEELTAIIGTAKRE